ncbi:bifunctional glycosyltransferase family 2 protein/CDP-glycerol:glycerophosphate glycerophosphotransferase [Streptomyces huasconensis]|uniref:Bifunctional glycosyltransferase family 2 protein/CDP-glycerol:glycerophosphate glycerophosphotransferase n=1 Tax=Streptomyces huasconensis TaxID=1854574 RepID=A0ABV3M5H6_9ACTN
MPTRPPRLSIIVPFYGVEQYLYECLQSLAEQTFRDFEVVMVDDESPDGCADIAREFALRDRRFRLVQQKNGGLGHARNTGTRHAHPDAEFITFVDSDDVLPDYAYSVMIRSLEESGSDFVAGNVHLLNSTGTRQSPLHRPLAKRRVRTHITQTPDLIFDRTAWNKVFRRAFWDRHQFAYPVGVLYEDTPVTLPAHHLAEAVDVIERPVYYWRQREGSAAPSITQRRTEVKGLVDRVAACDGVSRMLALQPGEQGRRNKYEYDLRTLKSDFPPFMKVLLDADDEFRTRFRDLTKDYLDRVDEAVLTALPAELRLKWHLVRTGDFDELLALLAKERSGEKPAIRRRLRGARLDYTPELSGRRVPKSVLRCDEALSAHAVVTDTRWLDGRLRVRGYAYIRHVDAASRLGALKVAALREAGTRRILPVKVRTFHEPEATVRSRQAHHCYDWAGFEFEIDPDRLRHRGTLRRGTWGLRIGVLSGGTFRLAKLTKGTRGTGTHPPYYCPDDKTRLIPQFRGGLVLRVEPVRALVTGHRLRDDHLELRVDLRERTGARCSLRIQHLALGTYREYPLTKIGGGEGPGARWARIPARDLREFGVPGRHGFQRMLNTPASNGWRTELIVRGKRRRMMVDPRLAEGHHLAPDPDWPGLASDDRHLVVHQNTHGDLVLYETAVFPVARQVCWDADGRLRIEGTLPGRLRRGGRIVLHHRGQKEEWTFPVTVEEDRFRVDIAPAAITSLAGTVPLRPGAWDVLFRAGEGAGDDCAVRVDRPVHARLPLAYGDSGYTAETARFNQLILVAPSRVAQDERSAYHQRGLQRGFYPAARRKPLRDAVLYNSFTGRQFSGNPRAVHEALLRRQGDDGRLDHLWVVRDDQVEVPPTARPVTMWTREWYEALARSRYIVSNTHLPEWVERRDGQVIVQTWHGTPLKRIGHDIENVQFSDKRYLEKMATEVPNWSFLVSPNTFSTPILRRAFRYEGEVLETGYPRNDVLFCERAPQVAHEVRRKLGLPPGKRVVLYAPTWRDDQFYSPGRYKLDLRIDLERARATLGHDHVLLVRKHPNVVDDVPGAGDGFVFDVSKYPDIADLFVISDMLITDYSSLMFDFAITGRPMFFFTYDMEKYREKLRGFYFDFEAAAPGPIVSTSDELLHAVRNVDGTARQYWPRYRRFRSLFCDLDDGSAADRVIDRMVELTYAA